MVGLVTEPVFTEEQLRDDGRNRVGKTGLQVGLGSAIVTIVLAVAHGRHWIHAGPDGSLLDSVVKDAYNLVVSTAIAALMNLRRLRGKQ